MVTVEVAFMPCGMLSTDGLIVNTKLPVVLWASLMVKGRTVPLTVNEPNAKVTSRSRALRGTRFLDSIVLHSSELNRVIIMPRLGECPSRGSHSFDFSWPKTTKQVRSRLGRRSRLSAGSRPDCQQWSYSSGRRENQGR